MCYHLYWTVLSWQGVCQIPIIMMSSDFWKPVASLGEKVGQIWFWWTNPLMLTPHMGTNIPIACNLGILWGYTTDFILMNVELDKFLIIEFFVWNWLLCSYCQKKHIFSIFPSIWKSVLLQNVTHPSNTKYEFFF